MATILMPLPDHDFDTTEAAVAWRMLKQAGHRVVIATEQGRRGPVCDHHLIDGVLFGKLGAAPEAIADYQQMLHDWEYTHPMAWSAIDPTRFDGLWLAGGHAKGMRQYLDSEVLQQKVAEFWALQRPVAAVCHGVLVLARARDRAGNSLLHGWRTTALPFYMEALAFSLTFWKLGRYYRTYPTYVQTEVTRALAAKEHFVRGPLTLGKKGSEHDDRDAFVVEDRNYLSARWPGDVYLLTRKFMAKLPA